MCRTYDYAAIIQAAYDGGTCRCGFGERNAASMQRSIAVMVGEVKTRHVGDMMELIVVCCPLICKCLSPDDVPEDADRMELGVRNAAKLAAVCQIVPSSLGPLALL